MDLKADKKDKIVKKNILGQTGEDLACEFLKKRGYRILARNYRKPWGEIDIISKAEEGTLVFVEVKTMSHDAGRFIGPEDQASGSKMKKVRKTCEGLVNRNPKIVNERRGWRIDLLAIVMNNTDEPLIRHYENV